MIYYRRLPAWLLPACLPAGPDKWIDEVCLCTWEFPFPRTSVREYTCRSNRRGCIRPPALSIKTFQSITYSTKSNDLTSFFIYIRACIVACLTCLHRFNATFYEFTFASKILSNSNVWCKSKNIPRTVKIFAIWYLRGQASIEHKDKVKIV